MSDFLRKVVSGNKARFKDSHLNIELDLVYLTDHVIIMGFPASGSEGIYRNRRDDVKKFLEHRHGSNFWVFNFCPIRENSYPVSVFNGRVSRYPFPDHHVPPLAILPLAAREIHQWLSGSPERVAVLHCKAGKGRSGTLACSYLLTLDDNPRPPSLERSYSAKHWSKIRADRLMESVPLSNLSIQEDIANGIRDSVTSNSVNELTMDQSDSGNQRIVSAVNRSESVTENQTPSASSSRTNTLDNVLALHTARRMKSSSSPKKKVAQGVSIPSQRRWLYYWSLVLEKQHPAGFWFIPPVSPKPKVLLRSIKIRMHNLNGVKMNLIKLANNIIERTADKKDKPEERGKGQIWVSLARYNDDFVDLLEKWERHTRDELGNMGRKRLGSEHLDASVFSDIFSDGKWDKSKMVRSFARLGNVDGSILKEKTEQGQIITQVLHPLSEQNWKIIEREIETDDAAQVNKSSNNYPSGAILSTASSMTDVSVPVKYGDSEEGVLLDAHREVRAKLYIGRVFMGWLWFIPVFHMSSPTPPVSSSVQAETTHFTLTRKEMDFAVGVGSSIIDIDVALDWVLTSSAEAEKLPPPPQTSLDSLQGIGEPDTGVLMATLQSAVGEDINEAVKVTQATD